MRTLSTYFGTAVIVASLIGCVSTDPNDILTTVTSATDAFTDSVTDTNDSDTADTDTETGTDSDTDATDTDPATDTDTDTTDTDTTDTDTTDTDTTDTETTDDQTGCFGCPCGDGGVCDEGLECADDNTCQLPEMTSDDPTTGEPGEDPWDPNTCAPPAQPLMVGGIDGAFCSNPCMADVDCPAGPVGTTPACALSVEMGADPSFCALVCPFGMAEVCPGGATCKEVPGQPGVGLCTYP